MYTPDRKDIPLTERISREGCVEGSFGAGGLNVSVSSPVSPR